jgi:homoserine dehydrogenase
VLARVAAAFGDAGVSIKSVWQQGEGDEALLLIVTHSAREADQRAAVRYLREVDSLRNVASIIRVESEEA